MQAPSWLQTEHCQTGISQAVRTPSELAYGSWGTDLVIERQGDELRIRPAQRRRDDMLGKLAKFSPDFMAEGRGQSIESERKALCFNPRPLRGEFGRGYPSPK
ncbi:hypothetical protein RA876_01905 [Rhodoferax antarcticus]|nr:hypothetical protein RA876_01905 [Rhodoferax antarcticus]